MLLESWVTTTLAVTKKFPAGSSTDRTGVCVVVPVTSTPPPGRSQLSDRPVQPASPVAPCGPWGPVSPVSPLGPWGPVSPVAPCGPLGSGIAGVARGTLGTGVARGALRPLGSGRAGVALGTLRTGVALDPAMFQVSAVSLSLHFWPLPVSITRSWPWSVSDPSLTRRYVAGMYHPPPESGIAPDATPTPDSDHEQSCRNERAANSAQCCQHDNLRSERSATARLSTAPAPQQPTALHLPCVHCPERRAVAPVHSALCPPAPRAVVSGHPRARCFLSSARSAARSDWRSFRSDEALVATACRSVRAHLRAR